MYRESAKRDPDPIQSLRVASTLADRYRAVVSGNYIDTSAIELAIGEAQQIYPEIWRHLDEARAALAAKDRDVRIFDGIRIAALRTLGVTHVDSHTTIDPFALVLGRLSIVDVKTATFNIRGYQLAVSASQALMALMPEVDWLALARAEDKEIRDFGSLRAAKWIGIAKWGGLIAALALIVVTIHHFATRPATSDEVAASEERPSEEGLSDSARLYAASLERIATLKRLYASSCDRQVRDQLAGALRAENREAEARKLERATCVPDRPMCGEIATLIADRQAKAFELEETRPTCFGALTAFGQTGFVIAVSGTTKDRESTVVRGIVSPTGEKVIVPFASSPEDAELIGVTDLDGDDIDEVVMASEHGFVISKIEGNAFRDILGPSCPGGLSVQRDFRKDRNGERRPVLTVPEGKPPKGCPGAGLHYFKLVGGKLVED